MSASPEVIAAVERAMDAHRENPLSGRHCLCGEAVERTAFDGAPLRHHAAAEIARAAEAAALRAAAHDCHAAVETLLSPQHAPGTVAARSLVDRLRARADRIEAGDE